MPLPLTADKLDAIPEAARGAYTQRDGKFVLDAEFEDVSGLKKKNAELIESNKRLKPFASLIGDRTAEEIQADLELAKSHREKKLKDEGNFDEMKRLHGEEVSKKDALIFELVAKNEATAAITAAGGKPKKLLGEVLKSVKVQLVNGQPTAVVVDAAGKPRIKDGQGTAVTVADLVEELKADPDYEPDFAASGASGSGARNNTAAAGSVVLIPKNASSEDYRRLKADAEKRGVPYKIAS